MEELRLKEEEEKRQEEVKYADNNFWKVGSSLEEQYDIDDLMNDLE